MTGSRETGVGGEGREQQGRGEVGRIGRERNSYGKKGEGEGS